MMMMIPWSGALLLDLVSLRAQLDLVLHALVKYPFLKLIVIAFLCMLLSQDGLLHFIASVLRYSSGVRTRVLNKKLRYREEHSASVVLSWCTL